MAFRDSSTIYGEPINVYLDPVTKKRNFSGGVNVLSDVLPETDLIRTTPKQEMKLSGNTVSNEMSMGLEDKVEAGQIVKPKTTAETIEAQANKTRNLNLALAGVGFATDILNANSAYQTVKGQAQLNIIQSRNQAADSLFRGRQAQSDAQSGGYNAGQDALLAMAAQGQAVDGAGVQRIQGSFEAMGIMNGMREEVNSLREALGFELEQINYEYQVEQARVARNNAVIGSGLKFGTQLAFAAV